MGYTCSTRLESQWVMVRLLGHMHIACNHSTLSIRRHVHQLDILAWLKYIDLYFICFTFVLVKANFNLSITPFNYHLDKIIKINQHLNRFHSVYKMSHSCLISHTMIYSNYFEYRQLVVSPLHKVCKNVHHLAMSHGFFDQKICRLQEISCNAEPKRGKLNSKIWSHCIQIAKESYD